MFIQIGVELRSKLELRLKLGTNVPEAPIPKGFVGSNPTPRTAFPNLGLREPYLRAYNRNELLTDAFSVFKANVNLGKQKHPMITSFNC